MTRTRVRKDGERRIDLYADRPADVVIFKFGGVNAVAKAVGVPAHYVYRWRAPVESGGGGGRIPAKHHGVILHAARRLRLSLCAEDLIDMRIPEDVQ